MPNSLFSLLVVHLLESSLVGICVLGILWACRGASASLRRTLGVIGLIKFAVPGAVLYPVILLARRLAQEFGRNSADMTSGTQTLLRLLVSGPAMGSHGAGVSAGLLAAWFTVTVVVLAWSVRQACVSRRRLAPGGSPASGRMARGLARASSLVGLEGRNVRVAQTESEGPGILGVFSPILVIPRALESRLTEREFESILTHELVHLKRRDNLLGVLRTVILAAFWHNPVVWLLCRAVALETEKACDEEVIRLTQAPGDYAEAILKTVHLSVGIADPGYAGAASRSVSSRLKSILEPEPRKENPTMRTLAIAAACLAVVLCAYADAPSDPASPAAAGNAYDPSKLSVMPRVLTQARPVYPPDLHARGLGATVVVDFVIDTAGSVVNACAVKPSNPQFGTSAVEAVRRWKFSPGQVNGRAVATHMQVPIVYSAVEDETKPKP